MAPSPGPTGQIDAWLGPARLQVAYPGLGLRDDVYATHGHYLDAHLSLPRAECVAAAARMRTSGPLPNPATPADYERVLRPLYSFSYAVAQARPARARAGRSRRGPSEAAWRLLSGLGANGAGPRRRLAGAAARAGFPAGIWALNRLLHSSFEAEISATAIFSGGVEAAAAMATRLQVDGVHVITGHTHRGGPNPGEARVAPAGRRSASQHRQLGLLLDLPPPRHPTQPLLAGDGDLGRGQRAAAPRPAAAGALARGDDRAGQQGVASSQSAMMAPISAPASSWRKCEAFSIARGGGRLSWLETRSPTWKGRTRSESARQEQRGPCRPRRPSATRSPSTAPGASGVVGRISGKARTPALGCRL